MTGRLSTFNPFCLHRHQFWWSSFPDPRPHAAENHRRGEGFPRQADGGRLILQLDWSEAAQRRTVVPKGTTYFVYFFFILFLHSSQLILSWGKYFYLHVSLCTSCVLILHTSVRSVVTYTTQWCSVPVCKDDPFWTVDTLTVNETARVANQSVCSLEQLLKLSSYHNTTVVFRLRRPPTDHPCYYSWINDTLGAVQRSGIPQNLVGVVVITSGESTVRASSPSNVCVCCAVFRWCGLQMNTETRWSSWLLIWSRPRWRKGVLSICSSWASAVCCYDTTKSSHRKSGQTHTHTHTCLILLEFFFFFKSVDGWCSNCFSEFVESHINLTLYTVNEPWLYSVLWCSGVSSVSSEAPHILKKVPYPIWLMVRIHQSFFLKHRNNENCVKEKNESKNTDCIKEINWFQLRISHNKNIKNLDLPCVN